MKGKTEGSSHICSAPYLGIQGVGRFIDGRALRDLGAVVHSAVDSFSENLHSDGLFHLTGGSPVPSHDTGAPFGAHADCIGVLTMSRRLSGGEPRPRQENSGIGEGSVKTSLLIHDPTHSISPVDLRGLELSPETRENVIQSLGNTKGLRDETGCYLEMPNPQGVDPCAHFIVPNHSLIDLSMGTRGVYSQGKRRGCAPSLLADHICKRSRDELTSPCLAESVETASHSFSTSTVVERVSADWTDAIRAYNVCIRSLNPSCASHSCHCSHAVSILGVDLTLLLASPSGEIRTASSLFIHSPTRDKSEQSIRKNVDQTVWVNGNILTELPSPSSLTAFYLSWESDGALHGICPVPADHSDLFSENHPPMASESETDHAEIPDPWRPLHLFLTGSRSFHETREPRESAGTDCVGVERLPFLEETDLIARTSWDALRVLGARCNSELVSYAQHGQTAMEEPQ